MITFLGVKLAHCTDIDESSSEYTESSTVFTQLWVDPLERQWSLEDCYLGTSKVRYKFR